MWMSQGGETVYIPSSFRSLFVLLLRKVFRFKYCLVSCHHIILESVAHGHDHRELIDDDDGRIDEVHSSSWEQIAALIHQVFPKLGSTLLLGTCYAPDELMSNELLWEHEYCPNLALQEPDLLVDERLGMGQERHVWENQIHMHTP